MKYTLRAKITVSCHCEVEADSEEEAIAKSQELTPALYFHGSGTYPEENWLIAGADGTPDGIYVDKFVR